MRTVRRAVGWLTLGLAGLGGCAEPEAWHEEPSTARTQARQGLEATVPAELVRDINALPPVSSGSAPSYFTVSGGNAYFFATTDAYGLELWKTDGTSAGTRLVRDLWTGRFGPGDYPRPSDSPPRTLDDPPLVDLEGRAYFAASLEGNRALWRTDGTPAGTVQVKELCALYCPYRTQFLTAVNGRLFFAMDEGNAGTEPWTSDGTEAGTKRLKKLYSGTGGSSPHAFTGWNGATYFLATSGSVAGFQLWRTDGTEAGTVRMDATPPYSHVTALAPLGGVLYFAASDAAGEELWRTDGTPAGTWRVSDLNPGGESSSPRELTVLGGRLYFVANDGLGEALWVTDGTEAGTVMLQRGFHEEPRSLTPVGQRLFFVSSDSSHGVEPWVTDGTPEGTRMLANIKPDDSYAAGSEPENPQHVGNLLYFAAATPEVWGVLWVTDGTPEGTRRLSGGPDALVSVDPDALGAELGGRLVFAGVGPSGSGGVEPWVSDGTLEGTRRLKDVSPLQSSSEPTELTAAGGRLYLRANDYTHGIELWTSDGTPAGTRVLDLKPGATSSTPHELKALDGSVLFFSGFRREELWRSDGTVAGTQRLKTFQPLSTSNQFGRAVVFEGFHYFTAADAAGTELWRSNGTPEGTSRVIDLQPGAQSGLPESTLLPMGGVLYFTGTDGVHGLSLWKTNGTAAGTQRVYDFGTGHIRELAELEGTLFFSGSDSKYPASLGLWRSDGTAAGTRLVKASHISLSSLTVLDGTLYYFAGTDLWRSSGTPEGTTRVATFDTRNTAISAPLVPMRGALFFSIQGPLGYELWRSDGTPEGTRLFREFAPGPISGVDRQQPFLVLQPEGLLLLAAEDELSGTEVWATDGAEVWRVTDLAPAEGNTNPSSLVRLGEFVYFAGDDGTGREPWRIPIHPLVDTTPPTLQCPADLKSVEATTPDGPLITYPPATASDNRTSVLKVTYSQPSGTKFPVGKNLVTVKATDTAGNSASCSFLVPVEDHQPPTLTCPSGIVQEATSPAGAGVSYANATASDTVSQVKLSYSHASGSTFPLGPTAVHVTATDAVGNASQCDFTVTVRDTTPPRITCPASAFVEATSPGGTSASYRSATATDLATASPTVTYSPPPGTPLPFGATAVVATAKDASGNKATCGFTLTVRDTTAPKLTCPADLTAEATSPTGAAVSWTDVTASDGVTSSPTVTSSHARGSGFPLGETLVTVKAKDGAGNTSQCAFAVTVRDTTPPELTCPEDLTTQPADAEGRTVDFPPATARDGVTLAPELTYDPAPGSTFPLGTTAVTVRARDAADNSASCGFLVTVPRHSTTPDAGTDAGTQPPADAGTQPGSDAGVNEPPRGEASGCGCAAGSTATSAGWSALLLLGWTVTRRRAGLNPRSCEGAGGPAT